MPRRTSVFIFLQRLHLPLCGLPHRLHLLQTQVGDGTVGFGGAALNVTEAVADPALGTCFVSEGGNQRFQRLYQLGL